MAVRSGPKMHTHYLPVRLLLLLAALRGSCSEPSFRAAAVQYTKPPRHPTAAANIAQVLSDFSRLARSAHDAGAQIVLFPEASIWGYANYSSRESMREYCEPIPGKQASMATPPCLDPVYNSTQLQHFSCMAIEHRMTVMVNMGDVQGSKQYNTEVCAAQAPFCV